MAPLDLIHLAQTSKPLRRLLMSKKSRTIWREVLGNVLELPPCPNDMDEPLYAALVFSQRCFVGPHCAASHIPLISGYRNAVRMARFGWTTLSVSVCVNSATRTSKCAPRRSTMYPTHVSRMSALLKARKCFNQCHNRGATRFVRLS